jgi:hypothetical protein
MSNLLALGLVIIGEIVRAPALRNEETVSERFGETSGDFVARPEE